MNYLVGVKVIAWIVVVYNVARACVKIYPFSTTDVMEELYLDNGKEKLNEARVIMVLEWDRQAFKSLLLVVITMLALYFLN